MKYKIITTGGNFIVDGLTDDVERIKLYISSRSVNSWVDFNNESLFIYGENIIGFEKVFKKVKKKK